MKWAFEKFWLTWTRYLLQIYPFSLDIIQKTITFKLDLGSICGLQSMRSAKSLVPYSYFRLIRTNHLACSRQKDSVVVKGSEVICCVHFTCIWSVLDQMERRSMRSYCRPDSRPNTLSRCRIFHLLNVLRKGHTKLESYYSVSHWNPLTENQAI